MTEMTEKAKNAKIPIKTKQFYTLFLLAGFSPLIRLSAMTGRAGWVSIIIACGAFFGLITLISLYKGSFWRKPAKIFALLYAAWAFVSAGFYLRSFAEKFAGFIMPGLPPAFFAVSLLALIYIILRGKFNAFVSMSDIFFYIVLLALVVISGFQLPKVRPENVLPVTFYDAPGILLGALPLLGVFAYITPLLFLSADVEDKQNLRKYSLLTAGILLVTNIVVFAITVGVFGSHLVAQMSEPFLMSVKTVSVLDSLERLESVFLLLWVVADVAIIAMFMFVFLRLTSKKLIILAAVGLYVFSTFDLNLPWTWLNLLFGVCLPVLIVTRFSLISLLRRGSSKTAPIQSQPD
jgi:hypothetical protein